MSRLRRLAANLAGRLSSFSGRVRRVERRELSEFRRWLENTNNLLHLSIVLFVPLLIGFVTFLTGRIGTLSYLLFPPLASGTYTLFSDPEGRYASPTKFVASLTAGALCGLASLWATVMVYGETQTVVPHPESAALAVFLTGLVTWAADVEAPSAFSTALLTLVSNPGTPLSQTQSATAYVVNIFLASLIVAGVFVVWREKFYEQRARFLYETVRGDDHVLVPMRGENASRTALFGARLAAAHDAGKVVLLAVVEDAERARPVDAGVERTGATTTGDSGELTGEAGTAAARLESCAADLRTRVGVPCEVVVAAGDPLETTLQTARNTNCDLVVTPYEEDRGSLSAFVRGVFRSSIDAVAFRSVGETRRWKRILVLVSRPGDTAHAMIDFALRLAGRNGVVSVTTCIGSEVERRRAETRLANLVETADAPVETRVSRTDVRSFISANAGSYDLLVLGSSGERSAASRFVAPPTFERLQTVDCDVAVFDRGNL
ncbi:universal stress protein [Halogeometricum limi]|uniref:Universal stress protein family protein n=1 Tax=Halogeometricum limi TaxID=555875 RepID=A0A1I6HK66_9EURY|nr:HPP family protein [Halogeometricum limi]SFR54764.1 Universal stress protein family protein [Halogeometricum limi]